MTEITQFYDFDVVGSPEEMGPQLHETLNDWVSATLPGLVVKDGVPSQEGAKLADRLLYQLRTAFPVAMSLVMAVGTGDNPVRVVIRGKASANPALNIMDIGVGPSGIDTSAPFGAPSSEGPF